jgi:hypothetical protein
MPPVLTPAIGSFTVQHPAGANLNNKYQGSICYSILFATAIRGLRAYAVEDRVRSR